VKLARREKLLVLLGFEREVDEAFDADHDRD
jgi:hypothetical protein